MKSHLLAIVVLVAIATGIMSPTAQAQYPKNVLIEQFTSATCGPCVPAAPVMERAFNVGAGTFVIKYHLNFPAPNDPIHRNAPSETARRSSIYGVQSIPTARVMGPNSVDPRNEALVTSTVNAQRGQGSPVSLKVLEENGRAKVRIISNVDLTGHRLFVAVVARSITIPNLPQTLPGSNGQTNFKDALLAQLTGQDGAEINLPANQLGEFEYPISLGSGTVWQGQEQYLVAWVQSVTNNQFSSILQVNASRDPADSTKLAFIKRSSVVATVEGTMYNRVARGGVHTQRVSLRNNGNAPATVSVTFANGEGLTQSGWSFTPSQPVTVAAGATVNVDVSATAPADRSVFQQFDLGIMASDGAGARLNPFFALVDGGRLAMYTGTSSSLDQIITLAGSVGNISIPTSDIVILPYNQEANIAYPPSQFDGAVFIINFGAMGTFGNAGLVGQVKTLLAAGKKIFLIAEGEMTANFHSQSQVVNQEAVGFLNTTLGMQYAGFARFVANNELVRFTLNGVANDPIGNGLTINGHTRYDQSWPTYQLEMDLWTLSSSSPSKSCLTIPVTTQSGQVVATVMSRFENQLGGRLVYSAVGTAGLGDNASRIELIQRVFSWLFPQVAPQITLSTSQVDFGTIFVNTTREREIVVTNSGLAPLEITGVTISGGQSNAFAVVEGGVSSTPVTVQPNATHRIKINFQPTSAGDKQSSLLITSNAGSTAAQVDLRGRADLQSSVATDVTSETGAIGLRLVGANPVTSQSGIELNVRGSEAVTVSVVDASGRTVRTLFDGASAERTLLTVDAADLNNGLYTIVATNGSERAVLTVVVAR